MHCRGSKFEQDRELQRPDVGEEGARMSLPFYFGPDPVFSGTGGRSLPRPRHPYAT